MVIMLITPTTVMVLVWAFLDYLDDLFLSGFAHGDGSKSWSALKHFVPSVLESTVTVARVGKALKGWAKRAPALSRFPIPMPIVFAILGELCLAPGMGPVAAVMVLMQFLTYLRPGELLDLQTQDLIQSLENIHGSFRHWALVVRPQEVGVPLKTGEFDKSLLLDSEGFDYLSQSLARLKSLRSAEKMLWPMNLEEFGKFFHGALKTLGLDHLGITLYSLRHAGASWDLLTGRRSYEQVKDRGGWKTDTSMQRYAKAARSQQLAGEMPYHVVKYGLQVFQDMHLILAGDVTNLRSLRGLAFTQLDRRPVAQVEADAVLRLCCLQPQKASES